MSSHPLRRAFPVSLLVSVLLAAGPSAQQQAPTAAPAGPQAPPSQPGGQGAQPVQPGPGQPPITFKTEVNYVEVDAVVTNEKGDFVKNLKADDFTVLEDGKPVKIELFNQVDIPREPQDRFMFMNRPVKLDVKSNRDPFAGRLYVIVLDDLHTGALRSPLVKKAAHQFIEKYFHANDVAAIVYTSGRTNASQEFTNNPALLLASIDKFIGNKLRSATLNKLDTYNQQRSMSSSSDSGSGDSSNSPSNSGNKIQDSDDFQRGYNARNALDTLRNVADFLSGIRGRRKALLYFSEGIDYPIYDIFDARDASQVVQSTKDAITAAARANVNFFTIDPRGLVGLPDENMDLTAPPEDPSLRLDTQGLMDELRLSQDSLRTLAEETGGIALVNTNDFAGYFDRVVRANSTYYVIGYYPPDAKRDGRFHKIDVRVKPLPGQAKLNVVARKGYANARGKSPEEKAKEEAEKVARDAKKAGAVQTSAPLRDVLNSPLQQSGVTIDVQAAPFKNSNKDASVALAIEIDPQRLNFKPAKAEDKKTHQQVDVFEDNIELSFFSISDSGKPLGGTRSEVALRLRPQNYQLVKAFGLRLNPRITLQPGRYQVRIGVRETGGGDVGTVFYDLDVPDFTKNDLTISGILLTAATAQYIPTPQPDEVLTKELLPLPATSRREFIQGDTLALFAEVYDNMPPNKPHKIDITTRLIAEDGREVFKNEEARDSSELKASQKGGGFGHTAQIPLKDVNPGRYLLSVDAIPRNRDKNTKSVSRETLIVVHPMPAELRNQQGGPAQTRQQQQPQQQAQPNQPQGTQPPATPPPTTQPPQNPEQKPEAQAKKPSGDRE
jgi:VWFA-related protein